MVSDKVEIHITYNLQFDSYLRASWWEEREKAGLEFNTRKTKITASIPITLWQIEGEKVETVTGFIFLGSKITADGDCGHEIKRRFLLGRKVMINLNSILKGRYIPLLTKVHRVKAMVFPVVKYRCWELVHKEDWAQKNWYFWDVVLEKTVESPLDCKEVKPISPKGNQPWIFTGGTDAAAPIIWPPDMKSWLFGKVPDAGKDWKQKGKRVAEDEMVR